jgi:hypothetical protein
MDLDTGNCTGDIDFAVDTVQSIRVVECDTWHRYEVAALIPYSTDVYPGESKLKEASEAECLKAFEEYVGVAPKYSRYTLAYVAPNASSWEVPADRVVACLVGSATGDIRGSARGDMLLFPKVGMCTGPQNLPLLKVVTMGCDGTHSYEVYAEKEIKSKEPPGIDEIHQLVDDVCVKQFEKYVGVAATESKYDYTWFLVGEHDWDKVKDHRLVCSAGLATGEVTGSIKGTKE